jgi:hypothetical protein
LELVKILRELWRRKALVAGVLALSLPAGYLLAFESGLPPQSRQYEVAIASSDILIDTRNSQVVAVGRRGPDLPTLAGRANLMGNLMTSGQLKEDIARSAGVSAEKLIVVPPADPSTPELAPVPVKPKGSLGVPAQEETILTLTTDEALPILHVEAQAPGLDAARDLSTATLAELRRYLAGVAAEQDVPVASQLVVREFGAPVAGFALRGLPRRYALVVTIGLILLGCAAILGWAWLVRNWKAVEAVEGEDGPDREGAGPPPLAAVPAPAAGQAAMAASAPADAAIAQEPAERRKRPFHARP